MMWLILVLATFGGEVIVETSAKVAEVQEEAVAEATARQLACASDLKAIQALLARGGPYAWQDIRRIRAEGNCR